MMSSDAGAERVRPAGTPAVLLFARTFAEAHLYMDINPCECGESRFERDVEVLAQRDGVLPIRFAGDCERCGALREFTFQVPDRPGGPPAADSFSFPDDGPSGLIDPGQWWIAARTYGGIADTVAGGVDPERAWRDPEAWEDMVSILVNSAAAVDEALKFLPVGASAMPAGAFWTATGREVYQAVPDEFRRDILERERAERWARLREFTDTHPDPDEL
ncbi:hypothetical protein [Rugosimonospora acidiphila]